MMKRFFQICIIFLGVSTFCSADVASYNPIQENFIIPQGTQLLFAKAIDGSLIELQDGAQFEVINSDREEILEWKTNSPLIISPNPYYFSGADFFITNRHTGTYVGANYSAGPVLSRKDSNGQDVSHPFTNRIFHIDFYYGEIILIDGRENQSRWEVDPQDIKHIRNWQKGETVVIGAYDNWYSKIVSKSKFALISYENLNSVKFVRANLKPL